jgi:hypothetical protein
MCGWQTGGQKGVEFRVPFLRSYAPCFGSAGDGQPLYPLSIVSAIRYLLQERARLPPRTSSKEPERRVVSGSGKEATKTSKANRTLSPTIDRETPRCVGTSAHRMLELV